MRIKKEAYYKLLKCQQVPPEIGGILVGSKKIVDTVVFDVSQVHSIGVGIRYKPNTKYLNEQLFMFDNKGKAFMGMFHTHAYQWESLSNADVQYIRTIMNKMPIGIDELFFPIVFPSKKIKSYIAKRGKYQIEIYEDEIELV